MARRCSQKISLLAAALAQPLHDALAASHATAAAAAAASLLSRAVAAAQDGCRACQGGAQAHAAQRRSLDSADLCQPAPTARQLLDHASADAARLAAVAAMRPPETDADTRHPAYTATAQSLDAGFVKVAPARSPRRSFDSAYDHDTPRYWAAPAGKGSGPGLGNAARPPLAPLPSARPHERPRPSRARTVELPQSASHFISDNLLGPLSRRYSSPVSPFEVAAATRILRVNSASSVQVT